MSQTDYEVWGKSERLTKTIDQQPLHNFFCQPALPLPAFDRGPLRSMQTLIELAVDRPVPIVKLTAFPTQQVHAVKTDTGQIEVWEKVEILFRQRCPLPTQERAIGLPFTIAGLGDRWEQCLLRWHQANQRLRLTFDHHFSLHRTAGMATEHRFVSVAHSSGTPSWPCCST